MRSKSRGCRRRFPGGHDAVGGRTRIGLRFPSNYQMLPGPNRIRNVRQDILATTTTARVHPERPSDTGFAGYSGGTFVSIIGISLVNHPASAISDAIGQAVIDRRRSRVHLVRSRSEPAFESERNTRVRVVGRVPRYIRKRASAIPPVTAKSAVIGSACQRRFGRCAAPQERWSPRRRPANCRC